MLAGPGVQPACAAALCDPAQWGQPCPCLPVTARGPSSPGCARPVVGRTGGVGGGCRLDGWPARTGRRQAVFMPRSKGKAQWGAGAGGRLAPAHRVPRDRSRVWAEPCLLPTATSKLSGAVEQWLSAAERLYGPYLWGRYV